MYSPVSRFKFLWGPFVIPFIPLSPLAITSGENTLYKIAIKQNKGIPPDNITCIIDGKEAYPKIIYAGRKNNTNQLYWIPCWTADSTYLSPYEPAANWANSKYCITETGFYMYTYYGINESAKKIAIYFKDNSAAPLFLKRKKGVQYVLEILPITTYY
jgi:hypothetical protein